MYPNLLCFDTITLMTKRFSSLFFLCILGFSMLLGLLPHTAYAANTTEEDMQRRKLISLVECLAPDHISDGDNIDNFNDFWDGDDGKAYREEKMVVGLDRDSGNGVQSCQTVLIAGIHVFTNQYDIEVENYFVEKMSGSKNYRNQATYVPAIDKDTMRKNRNKWMQEIVDKINALGPTKNGYVANRLGPLITLCYDIKTFTPSQTMGDKDFKATLNGKDYFYDFRDDLDDDSLKFIDQGDGGRVSGVPGAARYNTIGDIELGFHSGSDSGNGVAQWDPFKADFYPFGSDLRGFTGDHRGNGGLLDCSFIKTQFDAGLFVDSIVYSVDIDKDVMEFGVDANGNGKIEESEALTPIDSVGPPPAGDGTVLKCDNGGVLGFIHNPLEWLICPIINGLQDAIDAYDAQITHLLKLPTDKLFNRDRPDEKIGAAFHDAWSSFRVIAMVFLVIIALVMIISQAIAVGPFDAYTVKHVMPRLLIAVVLISVSWDLTRYAIDISNILGTGVRGLIFSPFSHFNGAININFGGAGLLITGGGASLALLQPFGLFLLAVTGIIAVVTALLILILREMLVMFLVIAAPIAIVCSILPNTQKVWKMWTSYFSRALLLFVLFSAVVATGHAFALMSTNLHEGTLGTIFAFIAYFGPYFMLPTIFKMSGGAMAAISGAAYGATQGIRGGLKNARRKQAAKKTQEYGQRAQTGHFFKGGTDKNFTGRLNRGLQKATLLPKAGLRPSKMKDRLNAAQSAASSAMSAKLGQESAAVQAVVANDDLLQAALHGAGTDADARNYLKGLGQTDAEVDENAALIEQAKRDVGFENFAEIAAVANAGTGTGYKNGPADMLATINRVAGGDRAKAGRMLAAARVQAKNAQRADLYGCGFTTSADMMGQMYRADPTGTSTGDGMKSFVNQTMTGEAVRTKSMGELASSRGDSFRNLAPAIAERLAGAKGAVDEARANFAAGTGTEAEVAKAEHEQKRILAHTSALVDYASAISEENAQVSGALLREGSGQFVDVIEERPVMQNGATVLGDDGKPKMERVKTGRQRELTYSEQMEYLEGDAEYKNYKKTIVASEAGRAGQIAAQAATAGGIPPPGIPPVPGAPGA